MSLVSTIAILALSCAPPPHASYGPITQHDLLSLRDVAGLSVAPDGSRIAYQLQRADEVRNVYESIWCVANTDGSGQPTELGSGGDPSFLLIPGTERQTGYWLTLAARWSPQSEKVGFLARRGGETQIEVCDLVHPGCVRATSSDGDVQDFVWSADGREIIYQSAFPRAERARRLAEEGARGFRFDDRFDVFHSLAPIRAGFPTPSSYSVVDVQSLAVRPALEAERNRLDTVRRPRLSGAFGTSRSMSSFSAAPVGRPTFLSSRDVRSFVRIGATGAVWTEPADSSLAGVSPPLALYARTDADASHMRVCSVPDCVGEILEFAPVASESAVFFVRREGFARSQHALYIWHLANDKVQRILRTDDLIRFCTPLLERAVCYHEGPISPRKIVSIRYSDGAIGTVVDPNSNLSPRLMQPAKKLEWVTSRGDQAFGYLVMPRESRPSHKLPLIIAQYRATGFLRGGVGDEVPIQAFAAGGFAVLVVERPDSVLLHATISDPQEIDRLEWRGLSERWRTLAAVTSGIDHVVSMGVADRKRVGVSGLSDGAETAVFGLLHCRCFVAASISLGVHDPISLYVGSDDALAGQIAAGLGDPNAELWKDLSPALNAPRISTPILAQTADRELFFLLQMQRAFAQAHGNLDLYVFPDEYHVKWQPVHRAAVYARNFDWMNFWLRGVEDATVAKTEQYKRWRVMRTKQCELFQGDDDLSSLILVL
jgi:dipeptidyl aminopeptidase/acylaminoacyl peptidase